MNVANKLFILILSATLFILSGCSSPKVEVVPYSPLLLQHLSQGRAYAADGRYELAKEQYLMALSASNSSGATQMITEELHSVDLMIKTQR